MTEYSGDLLRDKINYLYSLAYRFCANQHDAEDIAQDTLLHRARKNLNAFFGHHCQWILPDNHCTCQSWIEFVAHREQLKEEVRKHGGPPDFNDPVYAQKSDPDTMGKVLSLFRAMPLKKPGNEWYSQMAKKVSNLLKK